MGPVGPPPTAAVQQMASWKALSLDSIAVSVFVDNFGQGAKYRIERKSKQQSDDEKSRLVKFSYYQTLTAAQMKGLLAAWVLIPHWGGETSADNELQSLEYMYI